MLLVADKEVSLLISGTGDVLEPEASEHGAVMAIGSCLLYTSRCV